MAMCGVMRIEKRGRGAVHGLQLEANRTQEEHERGRDFDRSDIDWNRTRENIHLVKTEQWNKAITEQIHAAGLKERKNSTVMLDGLYTASREWFDKHTPEEALDYFKACLAFHVREFCGGDDKRVINAVVHLDEATPHMQVASVPIIEDEKGAHLSAKMICGGRADFRLHQDHFFEQVTKERGLERGEVREPAELKAHTTKREWQIATQEQQLEQARRETRAEQAKTQEVIDRRQDSIEQANKQKLEALRERDAARADRDMTKALASLQKAVYSPASVEVDILAEYEAKKPLFGNETPEAVKIPRADLERLQEQATVNKRTRDAAREMYDLYYGIQAAARDANENRIDKQAAADRAAVSREGQRADELERELTRTRQALALEQRKTADLTAQLSQIRERGQETRDVLAFFPDEWDKMKKQTERARCMERLYKVRNSSPVWSTSLGKSYVQFEGQEMGIRSFLREYLEECKARGIPHEKGMAEHLDNLISRDRDECER